MEVIRQPFLVLVNEIETMNLILRDTIDLIHATDQIQAIKRLITVNEIITLNLNVQRDFGGSDDIVWDLCALSDLKRHRHEMIVYHSRDFNPPLLLKKFADRSQKLLVTVQHRTGFSLA